MGCQHGYTVCCYAQRTLCFPDINNLGGRWCLACDGGWCIGCGLVAGKSGQVPVRGLDCITV